MPFNPDNKTASSFERRPTERLRTMLSAIAEQVNNETAERDGLSRLLENDCSLVMDGYRHEHGGIYAEGRVEADRAKARAQEYEFSQADNPNVQDLHRTKYGDGSRDAIVRRFKKHNEESKHGQAEMAIIALLHKAGGGKLVAARTVDHDDYFNHVDNILVDRRTGAAICAIDGVHEGGKGDRLDAKKQRVILTNQRGGARVPYGLAVEQGRLVRAGMANVPLLYMGFVQKDLETLLEGMDYDPGSPLTPAETGALAKLAVSLRAQRAELGSSGVPPAIMAKLAALDEFLDLIEGCERNSLQQAA